MSLGFYSFDEAKLQKVSVLRKLFLKIFEIKKGEELSPSFPLLIMNDVHSSDAPKIHQPFCSRKRSEYFALSTNIVQSNKTAFTVRFSISSGSFPKCSASLLTIE